jgi:hypothetical protein
MLRKGQTQGAEKIGKVHAVVKRVGRTQSKPRQIIKAERMRGEGRENELFTGMIRHRRSRYCGHPSKRGGGWGKGERNQRTRAKKDRSDQLFSTMSNRLILRHRYPYG